MFCKELLTPDTSLTIKNGLHSLVINCIEHCQFGHSQHYLFTGSEDTFIKVINMPLIVTLTMNYNRKCNRRDRQYCNSKAWDFYKRQSSSQTRGENHEQNGVSHTAEGTLAGVHPCTLR